MIVALGLAGIQCNNSTADDKSGEILVKADVIYPKYRIRTSPSPGEEPQFNSPSLQWPVSANQTYSIRLSSAKDFSQDLITKKNFQLL